MNRAHVLFRTPLAEIVRFDHPPDREHHDDQAEVSSWYAVSFIEAGSYILSGRGRSDSWMLAAGDMELTYPGIPVRYRHSSLEPDDVCLAVRFSPEVVAQSFESLPRRAEALRVAASDRTFFESHRLLRALDDADRLSVEFAAHALLPFLCGDGREPMTNLRRSKRFPVYLGRIRAAVELLTHEYAQQHSVFELARRAAMSPYHFVRTFRRHFGVSPGRYRGSRAARSR